MSSYLTVARAAEAEIEVKRSRFRCTVQRVEDEESVRALVDRLRRQHPDARHQCSAAVLGPPPSPIARSSDDGEPAGTAGAPMLEVLRGASLSDVVAVVSRWFGGTLLGAGGLVRAYGDAVRAGLEAAGTLRRELVVDHTLALPYEMAGRVETELRAAGVSVLGHGYADGVLLRLAAPPDEGPRLAARVAEVTGGIGRLETGAQRWVDRT